MLAFLFKILDGDERLGSAKTGGYQALMSHAFFNDVDWKALPTMTPPKLVPYLPPLSEHNDEAIWSSIYQVKLHPLCHHS